MPHFNKAFQVTLKQKLKMYLLLYGEFLFINIFLIWIIVLKSLLNLIQYCFCCLYSSFLAIRHVGFLASQPGIKLAPPALQGEVLTTGLPGKSLCGELLSIIRMFIGHPQISQF